MHPSNVYYYDSNKLLKEIDNISSKIKDTKKEFENNQQQIVNSLLKTNKVDVDISKKVDILIQQSTNIEHALFSVLEKFDSICDIVKAVYDITSDSYRETNMLSDEVSNIEDRVSKVECETLSLINNVARLESMQKSQKYTCYEIIQANKKGSE